MHTASSATVPNILQEITERERCSRNVIIRGIQESSSSILQDRISNDVLKITEVIKPYFPGLPSDLKSIRLGKPNDRGTRAFKVFFQSKEIAYKIVSDFNKNIRATPTDNIHRLISVTRDRTPSERETIRLVYEDLENRKKNGETNLEIKYRDGFHRTSQNKRHQASNSTLIRPKN